MRLLVTRPLDDAQALADRLEAGGHEALVEPLLTIAPDLAAPLPLDGARALLFTSANGVRAFALRSPRRDLPVFAVGAATAAAARAVGFAAVEEAGGDVDALAGLVAARLAPGDAPLVHVAGKVVAGDLAGRLEQRGFAVRRATLYDAVPAPRLSVAARAAVEGATLDGVLLFSPRTAAILVSLLDDPALRAAAGRLTLFALSQAVADAAAPLPWRRVLVAARPDEEALLALVERETGAAATPKEAAMTDREPTDTPQALPQSPPATPAARGASWPLLLVATVAVVALALDIYTIAGTPRREAQRRDSETALQERIVRLERELGAIAQLRTARDDAERRVRRLETGLAEAGAAIESLGARLETLDRSLGAEIARLADGANRAAEPDPLAALAEQVQALRGEIAQLRPPPPPSPPPAAEAPPPPPPPTAAATRGASQALASLRAALAAGAPPGPALAALRESLGGVPAATEALARLDQALAALPPDAAALRAEFARAAAAALRAARAATDDGARSWWQSALDRLGALISIRRVGERPGGEAEAVLARAEHRLAAGDLAGALAELAALPPDPASATAFAGWLTAARARLALDAALADVARAVGWR
jgi:uroporphyrinogen-III synthase